MRDASLSRTVIGASVGIPLAEGVEAAEQIGRLRVAGCTERQGLFLGRPPCPLDA